MNTYTVTAVRGDGDVWVFRCRELPQVISIATNLSDVYEVMADLIADAAGIDEANVRIRLILDEA